MMVDFHIIFAAQFIHPVFFKVFLIVGGKLSMHIGCFLRSVNYTSLVSEPRFPPPFLLWLFASESYMVNHRMLTFTGYCALNFDILPECLADGSPE